MNIDAPSPDALPVCEAIVSKLPFVLRRRVRWSECDPAGVVFAGQFSIYTYNAIEVFLDQIFDKPWLDAARELGVDTPSKAVSLVFRRALWPSEVFDMVVTVKEVRTSTMVFELHASTEAGEPVYDAEITMIAIKWNPRRAVPVPDAMRERLMAQRKV
jgi:acyl-CoA thioesterase FadM